MPKQTDPIVNDGPLTPPQKTTEALLAELVEELRGIRQELKKISGIRSAILDAVDELGGGQWR